VGRHELARPRRPKRRSRPAVVFAVAVIVASAFLTSGAAAALPVKSRDVPWRPEIVAAASVGLGSGATTTQYVRAALVANMGAADRSMRRALPAGVGSEKGLQVKTILAERAVSAVFPEIHDIGGVRPDALKWHPQGLAIDVMIPNYNTPAGKALGDLIVRYALENADRFDLNHVIWRQVFYPPHGTPHVMADLGDDNANHFTHVHIATNGEGYPKGNETYFG
jgi:hypothetical protein